MSEIPTEDCRLYEKYLQETNKFLQEEIEVLQAANKKKLQIPTDDEFLEKVCSCGNAEWKTLYFTEDQRSREKNILFYWIDLINENL